MHSKGGDMHYKENREGCIEHYLFSWTRAIQDIPCALRKITKHGVFVRESNTVIDFSICTRFSTQIILLALLLLSYREQL